MEPRMEPRKVNTAEKWFFAKKAEMVKTKWIEYKRIYFMYTGWRDPYSNIPKMNLQYLIQFELIIYRILSFLVLILLTKIRNFQNKSVIWLKLLNFAAQNYSSPKKMTAHFWWIRNFKNFPVGICFIFCSKFSQFSLCQAAIVANFAASRNLVFALSSVNITIPFWLRLLLSVVIKSFDFSVSSSHWPKASRHLM